MDCSSDDMGYQKRGRTRSHELNMVMVAFVTWSGVQVRVCCWSVKTDLVVRCKLGNEKDEGNA